MRNFEQQRQQIAQERYESWLAIRRTRAAENLGGATLAVFSLGLADPEAAETRAFVENPQPTPAATRTMGEISVLQMSKQEPAVPLHDSDQIAIGYADAYETAS